MSQAGDHNLRRLMKKGRVCVGGTAAAVDTLLAQCRGKRYKKAPMEKSSQGRV